MGKCTTWYHSSHHSKTATLRAIFIAPTKAQKILAFTIQRTTLPQSRPFGRASSLREGAGRGLHHSSGYSLKSGVGGRFSSPLRKLKKIYLSATNERHSLSHARSGVPAPSEREPGGLAPFIGVLAKIPGWRAIFIAPTKLKSFLHFTTQRAAQKFFTFHHTTCRSEVFYISPWSKPPPKKIEKSGRGWYNQEGSIKKIQRGNVHVLY